MWARAGRCVRVRLAFILFSFCFVSLSFTFPPFPGPVPKLPPPSHFLQWFDCLCSSPFSLPHRSVFVGSSRCRWSCRRVGGLADWFKSMREHPIIVARVAPSNLLLIRSLVLTISP